MNKKNTLPLFICKNYKKVITFVAVLMMIGMFTFVSSHTTVNKADASTLNQKYFTCITIGCDDTLWTIANEYMTEEYSSIDAYIKEVKSINNLTSDKINRGASLIVPYYGAPK